VSRDTGSLDAGEVASAAIESVAENLTDSLAAPLLYYVPAGISGAWAYRGANTADAMVGYRAGHLEYLGKVPARFDDVMNAVPARLASLALTTAAALTGVDAAGARAIRRRDHVRTASPNAGWTMSALIAGGALGSGAVARLMGLRSGHGGI
jgi:adenosylcobinamide-phosphate synthase